MSLAVVVAMIAMQGVTLVDGPEANAKGIATEYGSGVCRVSVFGTDTNGDEVRAEFSRRLRDGNLGVSLYGRFISAYRDKDSQANYPVTVMFDTGSSPASRSGGYDTGGFREYIWGGWGASAESEQTYAMLADASSFNVSVDGNTFGPFAVSEKGLVHEALDECEYDNS